MSRYKHTFVFALSMFTLFGLVAASSKKSQQQYNQAHLKAVHVGSSNPGFQDGECPDSPNGFRYGWHFVLPGNTTNFLSIEITYANAGKITTFISFPTGKHAYVYTETPDTILSGSAIVDGNEIEFNLSHVCINSEQSTTTTSTTTTTTTEAPTTTTTEVPVTTTMPTVTSSIPVMNTTQDPGYAYQPAEVNILPVTGSEVRRMTTQAIALTLGGAILVGIHYYAKRKKRKDK